MFRNNTSIAGTNVVIVLGSLELGGAERQALLLARYLINRHGATVRVWGFGSPGRAATLCEEYGIPWRLVPFPWLPERNRRVKGLVNFAWTLRRAAPDVVLPYTMLPNVICGLVWRWTGARLCVWNQRDEGRGRVGRRAERWAIAETPWFVSNCDHGAQFLIDTLGARPDRLKVIRNGVELAQPKADRASWRRQLGVDDHCFVVCMVANLSPFKDHVTLLQAWHRVVRQLAAGGLRAILVLPGRFDSAYESLQSLAADLALRDCVRFLGMVEDIPGLLGAVDLGVFSSRLEGSPNGVLECMAAGLAVAGTNIAGIRECVGPDGYRFLAPPGDVGALAERIVHLVVNPELRQQYGAANARRIIREFSPQRMCEETAELLSRGLTG